MLLSTKLVLKSRPSGTRLYHSLNHYTYCVVIVNSLIQESGGLAGYSCIIMPLWALFPIRFFYDTRRADTWQNTLI